MPTGYVKNLAKKHGTSVRKSESVWENAKQQAAKAGKSENFAYITSIYKKMMGEEAKHLSLKTFLFVTEMDDVEDIGYDRQYDNDEFPEDGDEFPEDGDEFPEDDEDDLEGHEGHELADIVSNDELDDEDEFPEDEFPGGDEMPDENGEFPPEDEDEFPEDEFPEDEFGEDSNEFSEDEDEFGEDTEEDFQPPSRDRFREGYNLSGSFLQELMFITEKAKKKPLKKAAKAVYRRDYIKTKNKPYRKYHSEPGQE